MSVSSTESVTAHGDTATGDEIAAIDFVLKLTAAAKAGLALLEEVEANGLGGALVSAQETRAAYDRLDEVQKRAGA